MGWETDPFGIHELRYFSQGEPTRLVKDGKVEAYDEPPTAVATRPAAPAAMPTAAPPALPGAPPAAYTPAPIQPELTLPPRRADEPPLLAQFRATQLAPDSHAASRDTGVAAAGEPGPFPDNGRSNGATGSARVPAPAPTNGWGPSHHPAPPPAVAPAPSVLPSPGHRRARAVSGVFKVAAWIVLGVGVLSALVSAVALHSHGGSAVLAALAVLGSSVLGAASLAFFACVLDLLVAIDDNTAAVRARPPVP